MSCCAVFCRSRTTKEGIKDPELSFHTFPKCPEIRNQWIKAVRRENWEPTKYSRLCSKHFEKSSFIAGLLIKKHKTDAVLVIFEDYPEYYKPSVAKKRKKLELTPRKRKGIEAAGVKTEDLPTTPRRAIKFLTTLSKTQRTLLVECQVTVVSLTFDGAPNNIAMAKHLGCDLDLENLNTQFEHNGHKISILLDPCHCLKLVRNTLGDKRNIYDYNGKGISFRYFELLHQLQNDEQMHLANKLRQGHIDYVKQKMKVKLAAQLLSQSVADALLFCRNKMKLAEFADCVAT